MNWGTVVATDTYKKRMKGHWQQGKAYKGDGEERLAAKRELAELIRESEEDYKIKYKKSKRRRNEKARLEHRIKWYEQTIEKYDRRGDNSSFSNWLRDDLAKAKKKYEKFKEPK